MPPNKQRLSSISTNEKRKIQAQPKILKRKRYQLTRFAPTILPQTLAVSGNDPAASGEPRCAWFWVWMIPKKGVGTAVPHPSRAVSAPVPPARRDKIYKSDEVFLIGETNTTVKSKRPFLIIKRNSKCKAKNSRTKSRLQVEKFQPTAGRNRAAARGCSEKNSRDAEIF